MIRRPFRHAGFIAPADTSSFNDPLASRTSWSPAKRGGMNFCSHKLVEVAPGRLEFKTATGAKLFYLLFFFAGLGALVGFFFKFYSLHGTVPTKDVIVVTLVGLIFSNAGGWMYYFGTRPIVFDKQSGHFWKGTKDPNIELNKESIKIWTPLYQIHALQLISEYCRGNKTSYYSHELNLILRDGQRINVVDHGKLGQILQDATTLSAFLAVPLWKAT